MRVTQPRRREPLSCGSMLLGPVPACGPSARRLHAPPERTPVCAVHGFSSVPHISASSRLESACGAKQLRLVLRRSYQYTR